MLSEPCVTRKAWFSGQPTLVIVAEFKQNVGIKGALSQIFSISLNSQNIYLGFRKPTNNGLFLLTIAILVPWNCQRVSLAADGQDGNGLQLEKLRLNCQVVFERLRFTAMVTYSFHLYSRSRQSTNCYISAMKLLPSVFGCRWPGWKRVTTWKIEAKLFKLLPRIKVI